MHYRRALLFAPPSNGVAACRQSFYTLYDAAMLSFTSYTKAGLRIATFAGFAVAALSFVIGLFYLVAKLAGLLFRPGPF